MKSQHSEVWQAPAWAGGGPETLYQCCHLERDTPEWETLQKNRISELLCLKHRGSTIPLVLGVTLDSPSSTLAMARLGEGVPEHSLGLGWALLWAGLWLLFPGSSWDVFPSLCCANCTQK